MEYKVNNCNYDIKNFIRNNICKEFDINYWDEWLEEQDYYSLQKNPNILVSVEENNNLIGVCAVKEINMKECCLNTFYVRNDYRNKGIGQKIFKMCMEYIRNNNYKKIVLTVDPKFEIARRIYEKNGFICESYDKENYEFHYYKYL